MSTGNKTSEFSRLFSRRNIPVPVLSVIYLMLATITTGIRSDHYVLVVIVNVSYFLSGLTRRFIIGFSIFIVYWIIFDSMKLWPNWSFHSVDIAPLYELEKSLFGISTGQTILTPNEYLNLHHNTFLDIFCSSFYLCWVPLPLIFAFYLFNFRKDIFLKFSLAFFFVNLIGFVIYYAHPAAPPWYYATHGDVLDTTIKSNAAGLLRFDQYFGITLFEDLYSKGSNVFAAMPSLHSAYPLIGFIYACRLENKLFRYIFAIVSMGIWFSGVYLYHHYTLDILAGILCALIGVTILEKVIFASPKIKLWLKNYEKTISPLSTQENTTA